MPRPFARLPLDLDRLPALPGGFPTFSSARLTTARPASLVRGPASERERALEVGTMLLRLRAAAAHRGCVLEVRVPAELATREPFARVVLRPGAADTALAVLYRLTLQGGGRDHARRGVSEGPERARLEALAAACGPRLSLLTVSACRDLVEAAGAVVGSRTIAVAAAAAPDDIRGWLEAGEALERFRLVACALGLRETTVVGLRDLDRSRLASRLLARPEPVQALVVVSRCESEAWRATGSRPVYPFH